MPQKLEEMCINELDGGQKAGFSCGEGAMGAKHQKQREKGHPQSCSASTASILRVQCFHGCLSPVSPDSLEPC